MTYSFAPNDTFFGPILVWSYGATGFLALDNLRKNEMQVKRPAAAFGEEVLPALHAHEVTTMPVS